MKFYICEHCKNEILMVKDNGPKVVCCGQPMTELVANTTDAAQEKHVPEVKVNGDTVEVNVGSTEHPMEEKHYIEWVAVESDKGGQIKYLKPGQSPKVAFTMNGEKAITVYAYCNLHGLWKKDL